MPSLFEAFNHSPDNDCQPASELRGISYFWPGSSTLSLQLGAGVFVGVKVAGGVAVAVVRGVTRTVP